MPETATARFAIEGHDLPGRSCGPDLHGRPLDDIHVGLARRAETVELLPGDAAAASWSFEVTVRRDEDGSVDYGGPYVHGRRGERSLGLRWVTIAEDDSLEVFRGAKLRLEDLDPALVERALATGGRLVARLGLTDDRGLPRCASVRPPDVAWSVE